MKKLKENFIPLLFMISIPISNIFYGILNSAHRGVGSFALEIDNKIPFIKEFILPYILWYPFILVFMVYICLKNREVYYRTLISLNIGLIVCYIIFYFFQTTVIRPELQGADIFTRLVKIIYDNDNPYNCFPSVHVITTYTVMKGLKYVSGSRIFLNVINIIGISIIISTQFVKQHVILDLISAIILGEILFAIAMVGYYREEIIWRKRQYSSLMMKKKLEN